MRLLRLIYWECLTEDSSKSSHKLLIRLSFSSAQSITVTIVLTKASIYWTSLFFPTLLDPTSQIRLGFESRNLFVISYQQDFIRWIIIADHSINVSWYPTSCNRRGRHWLRVHRNLLKSCVSSVFDWTLYRTSHRSVPPICRWNGRRTMRNELIFFIT